MLPYQKILMNLLRGPSDTMESALAQLAPQDLAGVFVDTAFLRSSLLFLKEEHWLQKKKSSKDNLQELIHKFLHHELSPALFLKDFFEEITEQGIKSASEKAQLIEEISLKTAVSLKPSEQKTFASTSLELMTRLFLFEAMLIQEKKNQGLNLGLSLYRSFDGLDAVFDLDYNADHEMKTDLAGTERLYEGAGVGVQSSYSTILAAIHNLKPIKGAKLIDLGSGYGRIGLVVGLMRSDIDFIGYEFVAHRVKIAQTSSQRLDLDKHVHFLTQDLSDKNFRIPEADIYYMYDPFSVETYSHVLSQLVEIGRRRKITIATKGNARDWLLDIVRREGWIQLQELDGGNLCLFSS